MPTYSYRCTDCGTAFDVHQAFTDDSLSECPSCGGRLRKVFGAVGVTFNGAGFYRTDSRVGVTAGATASGSDSSGTKSEGSKSEGSKSGSGSSGSGSSGSGSSGSTTSGSAGGTA